MVCKTAMLTMAGVLCALMLHISLTDAGSSYVRWGRSTCPPGARVLYNGYIAGSKDDHPGTAFNVLCAHDTPQWGKNNVPGFQDYAGYLVGAEFEMWAAGGFPDDKPFEKTNADGVPLGDREPVCVVCHVSRSTNIMIPGRQDCGPGNEDMRLEYKGFLMSEYYNRKRSEFLCIDEAPEAWIGSEGNKNGLLLYPVQSTCGSLPCPEYVDGSEVTCAVCSI